jgi:hypothetical protein
MAAIFFVMNLINKQKSNFLDLFFHPLDDLKPIYLNLKDSLSDLNTE